MGDSLSYIVRPEGLRRKPKQLEGHLGFCQ